MENFTLANAATLDAAFAAAQQPDAKFIAGGTDLLQLMKDEVERPQRLVDLDGLPLDQFSIGDDGARIGALVKMSDLADNPDLRRRYPVIAEALLASASPQVRNMATIGGNLLQRTRCGYFRDTGVAACNKRRPGSGCSATRLQPPPCGARRQRLLYRDAPLRPRGCARRARCGGRINEFYLVPGGTPERETVLRPGDLITAILVPPPGMGERSHYLKLRDRASFEFALVSAAVAIALDDGRIRAARIAVGGVGTKPWRLPNVEAALAGAAVTPTVLTEAAAHAAEGARPFRDNAFKIALMQRAVARALATVTA